MGFLLSALDESGLCFHEAIHESLSWVLGKAVILDDEVMQVVAQIVSTRSAAMAIVNPEKRALRPVLAVFVLRLHDIENDSHTVFVVVSDNPLVGIGRIRRDYSVPLGGALCRLVFGEEYLGRVDVDRRG